MVSSNTHARYIVHSEVARIELFTNVSPSLVNVTNPTLKMGMFRVKRADKGVRERYYVTDMRTCIEGENQSNAVLVHCPKELSRLYRLDIRPSYSKDNMHVYKMGYYENVEDNLDVSISDRGVRFIQN